MEKPIIDIKNLHFSYGDIAVLNDCNLSIFEGTITVLLGANGAGKTTLFGCIMKQLKTESQMIKVQSTPLTSISIKELSHIISYVPQISNINELDCIVRDFLVEGRTPYLGPFAIPGKKEYLIAEEYAKMVGIDNLLGKNMQCLSGGQLQLILITRALVQETPVILMDEPMSALDLGNQMKILKLIKELQNHNKTIIFSSHNPNHAFVLEGSVCMLNDGKIIASGNAHDCITQENLNILYGDSVVLNEIGDHKVCTLALTKGR